MQEQSLDNAKRNSRRQKHRLYDRAIVDRSTIGLKLHQLLVLIGEEIDNAYEGKNAWDDSVHTYVPGILDLSMLD